MTAPAQEPLPIEDYAVLTDGRTSALVGRDGTVAWLPFPTLDSPPVFAHLIDPERGGWFALSVDRATKTTRRYLPDTNVLETTVTTAEEAKVVITDSLNVGLAGRLPWTELARRVDGAREKPRSTGRSYQATASAGPDPRSPAGRMPR